MRSNRSSGCDRTVRGTRGAGDSLTVADSYRRSAGDLTAQTDPPLQRRRLRPHCRWSSRVTGPSRSSRNVGRGVLADLLSPLGIERFRRSTACTARTGADAVHVPVRVHDHARVAPVVRRDRRRGRPDPEPHALGGVPPRHAPTDRTRIAAGALLAALYALSDFGTPAIMRFDAFTR